MINNNRIKKTGILIVGDWVVDEYAFLVRHHSDISSATGLTHYRLCNEYDDITLDLCGAGHIMRILHELNCKPNPEQIYGLIGIGIWHERDQELISHLLHARIEQNRCTVSKMQPSLNPLIKCEITPQNEKNNYYVYSVDKKGPTIRVIRQYNQKNGDIEQINRVDFEPIKSISTSADYNEFLSNIKLPEDWEIKAIVIDDLAKGVVNKSLIDSINLKFPTANWYIRSKSESPEWIKNIKKNINLYLVGPEIGMRRNPTNIWLAEKGLTYHVKQILENASGKYIVTISNRGEVIIKNTLTKKCFTGKAGGQLEVIKQLNWTTTFFAHMIDQILSKEKKGQIIDQDDFEKIIRYTNRDSGVPLPKALQSIKKESREPVMQNFEWDDENEAWKKAFTKLGFIKLKGESQSHLDVWRSYTELPNYVTCAKRKQETINIIGHKLRAFREKTLPASSLSIFLVADPGTGKTYLAKNLATTFNYNFVYFDLTQIFTRDGLTKIFDTIATTQANDVKPVLVFIDEINSRLDGDHSYSAFLSPLEESVYIRDGQRFSLKPCAWIFASTRPKGDLQEKYSDFQSRMTMILNIDYLSLRAESLKNASSDKEVSKLEEDSKLEQVYLGAVMIRRFFPDVTEVSERMLKSFYQLQPEYNPSRIIRNITSSLQNVQYGNVTLNNLDPLTIRTLSKLKSAPFSKGDDEKEKNMLKPFVLPKNYQTWLKNRKDESKMIKLRF